MSHSSILGASLGGKARRATGTVALLLVLSLLGVAAAGERPHKTAEREVAFGVELAPQGLWREAVYRWQRAIQLDPDNAKAQNNLGVAYEQQGEFELAEQHYQKALELAPDNTFIRQNYELFREANEQRTRKSTN